MTLSGTGSSRAPRRVVVRSLRSWRGRFARRRWSSRRRPDLCTRRACSQPNGAYRARRVRFRVRAVSGRALYWLQRSRVVAWGSNGSMPLQQSVHAALRGRVDPSVPGPTNSLRKDAADLDVFPFDVELSVRYGDFDSDGYLSRLPCHAAWKKRARVLSRLCGAVTAQTLLAFRMAWWWRESRSTICAPAPPARRSGSTRV